jgi:hypothetical protein
MYYGYLGFFVLRLISFSIDKIDSLEKEVSVKKRSHEDVNVHGSNNGKPVNKEDYKNSVLSNDPNLYNFENYILYLFFPSFNTFASFIRPRSFLLAVCPRIFHFDREMSSF